MRLIAETHFAAKRYNRPGMVRNSVIRPSSVVEMLYLSHVVVILDLECPDNKVSCLFSVHQSNTNVTVLFLFTRRLRPIHFTLWLSIPPHKYQSIAQSLHHTHTHPFNGPFSRTTRVSRYQKGKTNLDFTEARDSEWRWHQLGICKSAPRFRQKTMPAPHHSVFLQARCPSCRPTNSVKALKAHSIN